MTLTTHAAIGAALGAVIGNPLIGFTLGLISHFLVDMIPHGDNNIADTYRVKKNKRLGVAYITVDAAIAIIMLMSLVSGRPHTTSNIAFSAAVIGSILPDLLVGIGEIYKHRVLKSFFNIHFFFHDFFSRKYGDAKLSHALIAQAIFVGLIIYWMP